MERWEDHVGLVKSNVKDLMRKRGLRDYERDAIFDDAVQVGLLHLTKDMHKYDSSRSKFSTFATLLVRNRVNEFLDSEDAVKNIRPRTLDVRRRIIEGGTMGDRSVPLPADFEIADNSCPHEAAVNKEFLSRLDTVIDDLPARESDMVRKFFGVGEPKVHYAEIARQHGLAPTSIYRIIERSLARLRQGLCREEAA